MSYDHDVVTLYIIKQEHYSSEGIEDIESDHKARLIMREGVVVVQTEEGNYTLQGEKIL